MARETGGQKGSGEATLHWNLIPSLFYPSQSLLTSGHSKNLHYSFRLLLWIVHCAETSGLCGFGEAVQPSLIFHTRV